MTQGQKQRIEPLVLIENEPKEFPSEKIFPLIGEFLWKKYSSQVSVDFPSPKTNGQWKLTSLDWVGFIPCPEGQGISLKPKVPLENLFRMLEYAYHLKSFRFLDGLVGCTSMEDLYERLAHILAKKVLDRGRKGFYQAYVPESDDLPFLKGRLNIRETFRRPWDVRLPCDYQEHTVDIEENQILCWTLFRIAQSRICTKRVLPTVHRAYHALRGLATIIPYKSCDCLGRLYNRLNEDYRPLHALCRFFLEHTGPSHEVGDQKIIPFLVNMPRLFELFVAEWLKDKLPRDLFLKVQEQVVFGKEQTLAFKIDLVVYERSSGKSLCVLDTKYKTNESPDPDDIAKVVAYAEMTECTKAILVYPSPFTKPVNVFIGKIQVRSMTFSLAGDLEKAGNQFKDELMRDGLGL